MGPSGKSPLRGPDQGWGFSNRDELREEARRPLHPLVREPCPPSEVGSCLWDPKGNQVMRMPFGRFEQ